MAIAVASLAPFVAACSLLAPSDHTFLGGASSTGPTSSSSGTSTGGGAAGGEGGAGGAMGGSGGTANTGGGGHSPVLAPPCEELPGALFCEDFEHQDYTSEPAATARLTTVFDDVFSGDAGTTLATSDALLQMTVAERSGTPTAVGVGLRKQIAVGRRTRVRANLFMPDLQTSTGAAIMALSWETAIGNHCSFLLFWFNHGFQIRAQGDHQHNYELNSDELIWDTWIPVRFDVDFDASTIDFVLGPDITPFETISLASCAPSMSSPDTHVINVAPKLESYAGVGPQDVRFDNLSVVALD